MKVSELAQLTSVSAHRLRRYEEQGLLRAERGPSGYREFGEHTVREVIFISMSRDLGFSLKQIADTLPRYRSGSLTFDEMVHHMRTRIAEVDAAIAAQRELRKKLVSHIAWLQKRKNKRKRSLAQRPPAKSAWPSTRKERP
ncbi:MAG: MerR family transcriptional regulator [Rhizobacter sp.]|nr:MerR family transcriptional regulator [Rhizobacter sp.]